MIPKKEWLKYKKEHPSICATCYHYQSSKKQNEHGYCYGLPPITDKSIKIKPHRRACSLHQNNQSDIIKLSIINDLFSSVFTAIHLYSSTRGDNGH